ncbi:MAG TPA: SPOR domain-containing protein [Hyphomicrobiaceae bacterium]|nr:SPOR domain-containing protein [Hyphomicrobiaceae bacterium]
MAPAYHHDPSPNAHYGARQDPQGYNQDFGQWGAPQEAVDYDLGDYGVPASGDPRGPFGTHPGHRYSAPPLAPGLDPGPYGNDEAPDYEDEEPPRSGRRWLIAAALIGSIGIGGGIAYAYKSYFMPRGTETPPVVRASKDATRTAPENPGGKRFANADSRLMGRLESDESAAPAAAVAPAEVNGVRRVSTVAVGRDGSLMPPEASAPPMRPTVSVPGLTIVDGFGRGLAPPPAPPPAAVAAEHPAQSSSAPARPATTPEPTVIAKASQPALSAPPPRPVAAEQPAIPPPQAVRPPAPEKSAPTRSAAASPPAEAAQAPANGYVAVLASHKSRIEALTRFADLQQKYDVLKGKIPDVLEADLSARGLGTMYRLVVGPPGSREAASAFCGQIKSAGHPDCWVTAY